MLHHTEYYFRVNVSIFHDFVIFINIIVKFFNFERSK